MGSHLVHLTHWLMEETENGGPLAIAGIVLGGIIGLLTNPLMQTSDVCESTGIGRDAFGHCPKTFSVEALVIVLAIAAACGAVGAFIGWAAAQGKPQQ